MLRTYLVKAILELPDHAVVEVVSFLRERGFKVPNEGGQGADLGVTKSGQHGSDTGKEVPSLRGAFHPAEGAYALDSRAFEFAGEVVQNFPEVGPHEGDAAADQVHERD